MKKCIGLFLFLVNLAGITKAQEEKPHFVRILAGASVPMGVYGKNEFEKDGGNYAQTGLAYGIEGAWFFHKNLGAGINATWVRHTIDGKSIENYERGGFPNISFGLESEHYKMNSLLLGLYFHHHIYKWISIGGNTSIGLLTFKQPNIKILGSSNAFLMLEETQKSFAYQLGANVNVRIAPKVSVVLESNLLLSNLDIEYRPQRYDDHIRYLNFLIGIQFTFNNSKNN